MGEPTAGLAQTRWTISEIIWTRGGEKYMKEAIKVEVMLPTHDRFSFRTSPLTFSS